jgi:hypothetical protein
LANRFVGWRRASADGGQLIFDSGTGTYNITANADFSKFNKGSFDFEDGVLNIANSTFAGQTLNYYGVSNNLVNIQGAQTINLGLYSSQKNSGPMVQDGPNDTLTQSALPATWPSRVQGSATNNEVVKIEAGATLGGNGISAPQIVAEAATSVIAPGDPGYQSAAGAFVSLSSGTLHLLGGLAAANGLTMDFKLDSSDFSNSDAIDFGQGAVSIGGVLTINLTSLDGGVATDKAYTIMSGEGDWSGFTPTSTIITAPAGYTATGQIITYGDDNTYQVTLTATPEPSTYALLIGGLAVLGFLGVRQRRSA